MEQRNEWLFCQEMCKAGILFGKAHFYGYAHLEENIDDMVLNIATTVVDRIKNGLVKPEWTQEPKQSFKRY